MLKSLEMFGFKSFADRTRFDFAPGVTCVVGPNGSGKSNVVDSIKWILGDQSAKSLRGKEMTDVIFNGSSSRKASGFAEATLTFDNRKRFLGIDADEVQVGRRLYRSGESEYLINRAPSRLKDVRDLLMGTGAGSAAYNIIEQGRVDQLLQSSNVNRRAVFEEAAGISRFKARKIDAQRKLERVDQNLLRLTDIVQELSGRLNTMRQQAQKAARFRKYSTELRELRVGYAADEYRELSEQLGAISENHDGWQSEIESLKAKSTEIEQQQAALEVHLTEVEDALSAAQGKTSANREAIAGYQATAGHQQTRYLELSTELERLIAQQKNLSLRTHDISGELQEAMANLEDFESNFAKRHAEVAAQEQVLNGRGQELTAQLKSLEALREQSLEAKQHAAILGGRISNTDARIRTIEQSIANDEERVNGLQSAAASARDQLEQAEQQWNASVERQNELRSTIGQFQQQYEEARNQRIETEQKLTDLREERMIWVARRQVLEDLESRNEGIGVGVREILNRARESQLTPWNQIHGCVADLLQVDLEHAPIIEVALGARSQLIVLDEADPLFNYLQEPACLIKGRVGFLALAEPDTAPGSAASPVDLSGQPGVVSRADQLVQAQSEIAELPKRLLSDTWVVTSLRDALALSSGAGRGCRYVTLQGELLEADGRVYAGTFLEETNVVSRRSELRRLKNDLTRLDQTIEATSRQLEVQQAEVAAAEVRMREAVEEQESSAEKVSELKTILMAGRIESERLQRDLLEANRVQEEKTAELQTCREEREATLQKLVEKDAEVTSFEQAIAAGEEAISAHEAELTELRDQLNEEKLKLAKQEERLETLQSTRFRLDEEQDIRAAHREEAIRRLKTVREKRDQLLLQWLNTCGALAEQMWFREGLSLEQARHERDREQVREVRSQLSAQELKYRHALRELEERAHEQEMNRRDLRHKISNLEERLSEEFGVSVMQAAERGESAIRDYLQEPDEQPAEELVEEPQSPPVEESQDFTEDQEQTLIAEEQTEEAVPQEQEFSLESVPEEVIVEVRKSIEERIAKIRRKLKSIGNVSSDSLQELEELEARHDKLNEQLQDLTEAKNSLEEIIRRINSESRRLFKETFEEIRRHFQEIFRKLFGGGDGDIILEDAEDILECGIDVVARPPGKELRSISLLSGGEKTMTAVGLLMALFQSRPSPFCILDEVDAALDDANIERYVGVIEEFQDTTQFIVITHAKRTMVGADVLYGVTLEESGISKRMSVKFEDVSPDGHFKIRPHGDQEDSANESQAA